MRESIQGGEGDMEPVHRCDESVKPDGGSMIWAVIGAVADLAGGYLNSKKKAVAKQKLEVAKIEAQTTKALQDGE